MEDVSLNQINKDLAEYMGFKYLGMVSDWWFATACDERVRTYTSSLDALVPVWEKSKLKKIGYNFGDYLFFTQKDYFGQRTTQHFHDGTESIQEAAAIATWKAVEELKNG